MDHKPHRLDDDDDILGRGQDSCGYAWKGLDHGGPSGSSDLSQKDPAFLGCFLYGDLGHYRRNCPQVRQRDAIPIAPGDDRSQCHDPQDGLEARVYRTVSKVMVLVLLWFVTPLGSFDLE